MGEAKNRRDRVQRVAHQRGYSTPPEAVLVDGEWFNTETGARQPAPGEQPTKRAQAPKRDKRMGYKARTTVIEGRKFEFGRTHKGRLEVFEHIEGGPRMRVKDAATFNMITAHLEAEKEAAAAAERATVGRPTRVSVRKTDPGFAAWVKNQNVRVFVDDVEVKDCVTADDLLGLAVVHDRDENGKLRVKDGAIVEKQLTGIVRLRWPEDSARNE